MRKYFIYTILYLFCFIPVAAQEVPFEGLHLDDLISIPGEQKPGIFSQPLPFSKLPDFNFSHSDKSFVSHWPIPSLPGMTSLQLLKANNLRSMSFWKPSKRLRFQGNYFSSGALPIETHSSFTVRADVEARYKLTNKFGLYFSTNYISDRYRTPRSLYTIGAGGGVTYQFSERFMLKTGAYYQYNTVFRRWEWMYLTGFLYCF